MDLSEIVSYQGKQMKFKEMMMAIKVNGSKLFIAIEKGVRKHKNTAFLLIKPTRRREAK